MTTTPRRRLPPRWISLALPVLLALGGCSDDASNAGDEAGPDPDGGGETEGETPTDPPDDGTTYLSPTEHLARISMALRGARPSADELQRVEADPEAIGAIVDEYLEDPRFGETIRYLHNDTLLVAQEIPFQAVAPFEGVASRTIAASVMNAPLHFVEYVVRNDRPYTELVTADYMLVDETAAIVSGTPYDLAAEQWQVVSWTDGRPSAGLLSQTAFFVRHQSAGTNYNRGRANAVSRSLLCYDFLSRDVEIDGTIDLSDPDAVSNAVVENAACASCHQTLDPLASFFFVYPGNLDPNNIDEYPVVGDYRPQTADDWQTTTGRPPALFGTAGDDLAGLGQLIADDPRFSLCAAQRFYAYFTQARLEDVPLEVAAGLQAEFVDAGFNAKALTRAIMLSDEFRISHTEDETAADELIGYKKARPYQIALLMEDLTGFRWEFDPQQIVPQSGSGIVDVARTSTLGFQVLGGGMDSFFVPEAINTVNATSSLFIRAYAAEAASFVVERDFAAPVDSRRLLTIGEGDTDEAAVRQQLADLHLRVYAEQVGPDDVDDAFALFTGALAQSGDAQRAWKTTLTAMFQDLRVIYY